MGKDCWVQRIVLGMYLSLVGDSDKAACGWRALQGGQMLVMALILRQLIAWREVCCGKSVYRIPIAFEGVRKGVVQVQGHL